MCCEWRGSQHSLSRKARSFARGDMMESVLVLTALNQIFQGLRLDYFTRHEDNIIWKEILFETTLGCYNTFETK